MTEHLHATGPANCLEVSDEVCLTPFVTGEDRHVAGFLVHFEPVDLAGRRRRGEVNVDPDRHAPLWEMQGSFDDGDLTLSPSIEVSDHTGTLLHGRVRNGKWVPA